MDAPTVKIGKFDITLVPPSPLASTALARTREQVEAGDNATNLAYGAAALRECWPDTSTWPGVPVPRKWRPGIKIETLGQECFDGLHNAPGVTWNQVISAGSAAMSYAISTLRIVTEPEVQAAEDFSAAPRGG